MFKDLKHQKPCKIIQAMLPLLYNKGHYLPYSHLCVLKEWLLYKKPIDPQFYNLCVVKGIYTNAQTARNQMVILRRMGVIIEKQKLLIY